ncbi:MAG: choice-of-anchor D domain-containing protein [Saprospiraceae bacterium]|nr:choice-of-anchor D domain-containing protein [Lewinella sp.]
MNIKHLLSFLLFTVIVVTGYAQVETGPQPLPGFIELRTTGPTGYALPCDQVAVGFTTVNVGETYSRDFLIRNPGGSTLLIHDLEIAGSTAYSITVGSVSAGAFIPISPGEELLFTIHFTPTIPGDHDARLLIHSSNPFNDPCGMRLEGTGYLPQPGTLRIREEGNSYLYDCDLLAAISFLDVHVGTSVTRTFYLENVGDEILTFFEMNVAGSDAFSIAYHFPYTGAAYPIAPGANVSFDITFTPVTAGYEEAVLEIYTSDEGDDPCVFTLQGHSQQVYSGTMRIIREGGPYPINCSIYTSTEFDDLPVGESQTYLYLLQNTSSEPLYFYGIDLGGAADFSIELNFPFDGIYFTIPPGEEVSYRVTFSPGSPGEKDADYTVRTSDPENAPCTTHLEGGGLDESAPHLNIFRPTDGSSLYCGDTFFIDLSETQPGSGAFLFRLNFRNYGLEDLIISGEVSIAGIPGSGEPITPFQSSTLQWKFLYVEVYLPGNEVTTLVFDLVTNDPNHPKCRIYVEINQVPGGLKPAPDKNEAIILRVGNDINKDAGTVSQAINTSSQQDAGFQLYPTITYDWLRLESKQEEHRQYQIVNSVGQSVLNGQTAGWGTQPISVEKLPAGMYYLQIEREATLRFVKQ